MKTSKLIIAVLVGLLTMQVGCIKNKNKPNPKTVIASKEILDYEYFKKGTWWVYEDSLSGNIDSVVIFKSNYKIDTVFDSQSSKNLIGYFDKWQWTANHSFEGWNHDFYYDYGAKTMSSEPNAIDKIYTLQEDRYIQGVDFHGPTTALSHPFTWFQTPNSFRILAIYDSLIINGKQYANILVIEDIDNVLWPPDGFNTFKKMNTYTYWAKNIGIIKRTMENDKVKYNWQLKNYHIEQ